MPIVKVIVDQADEASVLKGARLIERYDAFLLIETTPAAAREIARRHLVEDITAQYQLDLPNVRINTSKPRVTAARVHPHPAFKGERVGPGAHHYVVQFVGPVKDRWLSQLRAAGAQLRTAHSGFAYIVKARQNALPKIAALPFVRWVGHLPYAARVAPGIVAQPRSAALPRRRVRPNVYRVEMFDGADTGRIASAARRLAFKVLTKEPGAALLILETTKSDGARAKQIQALSAVHGVKFIRQQVLPRTTNNVATTIMGNSFAATSASGLKLAGAGEIVAVCDTGIDTGDPATIHPDFAGRVVAIKSYPITAGLEQHSSPTRAATTAPADLDCGPRHPRRRFGARQRHRVGRPAGSAADPRASRTSAKLVFQAVEQEMKWKNPADLETYGRYLLVGHPGRSQAALPRRVRCTAPAIHSNSWGGGDPGAYDDQCAAARPVRVGAQGLLRRRRGRQRRHRRGRRRQDQPDERDSRRARRRTASPSARARTCGRSSTPTRTATGGRATSRRRRTRRPRWRTTRRRWSRSAAAGRRPTSASSPMSSRRARSSSRRVAR